MYIYTWSESVTTTLSGFMQVVFNKHFPLAWVMNTHDLGEGAVFSPAAAVKFPREINNAPRQAESCGAEAGRF